MAFRARNRKRRCEHRAETGEKGIRLNKARRRLECGSLVDQNFSTQEICPTPLERMRAVWHGAPRQVRFSQSGDQS